MTIASPYEYLEHVRSRLASFASRRTEDVDYDEGEDLRRLFPFLAGYASGQKMFAPRQKAHPGYGVESFVLFLASQCDGALARDGKGFDVGDASEGHRLAAKLSSASRLALTASERLWALERCGKYRQQLTARYGGDYGRVMEGGVFLFAPAPDKQATYVQHVRYNEESRSVSFSLPSGIGPRERDTVMREMWALVRSIDVAMVPSLYDVAARLRRDWEKHRLDLTFVQSDHGGRDLVRALELLGYTKDDRVDAALDSDVTSYLRVLATEGPDYDGRMLVGYLHCISPSPDLVEDLYGYYAGFGCEDVAARPAVNLSKKNGYEVHRVFVAEDSVDGLEEILERHGVQNHRGARTALEDPRRAEFQHPLLRDGGLSLAGPVRTGPGQSL